MTDPSQVVVTVGEPNWAPLEQAVPVTDLENFMYMGCAGEIVLYKHRLTRRYLNIHSDGCRFYRQHGGVYAEIEKTEALEYVRH
jgi:hypothetical protein